MLIIAGRLRVDPADRDAYVRDCVAVVEQARAAPGCLDFAITADTVEADRINIYERWDTDANLQAFRSSGPSAGQTAQILDADVRRYLISAEADA
ncbi:MAG: putative quinol monooxygenase [Pseudonocardiales bacterium]